MRLNETIVTAIPSEKLPIVCTLRSGAYQHSYKWLTIREDLSFELKIEEYGQTRTTEWALHEMCDVYLHEFDAPLDYLDLVAKFNISKAGVIKKIVKHGSTFVPKALPLALISKRMDVYTSGEIIELVAWLKDNRIKYELDIKMVAPTC